MLWHNWRLSFLALWQHRSAIKTKEAFDVGTGFEPEHALYAAAATHLLMTAPVMSLIHVPLPAHTQSSQQIEVNCFIVASSLVEWTIEIVRSKNEMWWNQSLVNLSVANHVPLWAHACIRWTAIDANSVVEHHHYHHQAKPNFSRRRNKKHRIIEPFQTMCLIY